MDATHFMRVTDRDAPPLNTIQEETQLRLILYSSFLLLTCGGVYLVVYIQTLYILWKRKGRNQRKSVTAVLGVLFAMSMLGTGIRCYQIESGFVSFGATQHSIYLAISEERPAQLHLVQSAALFGSFILADWLMVWRCYHVWGGSLSVIWIPSVLLSCEIVVYFVTIIFISANIDNVTPSKAMAFNTLQLTLYIIPAVLSVITTALISYRITKINTRRNSDLKRLVDIIVHSSAVYTVLLVMRAAFATPVPLAQRTSNSAQIMGDVATYLEIFLMNIAGLAPTVMVARATLLTDDKDSRFIASVRSRIQFARRSVMQSSTHNFEQVKPESMGP
ncbi:hypothetical protein CPC08DRAFT_160007 [Agrocybe pediades]|nr:hypothetical protein CPC08DRAFT_160007 [Agrocybe pediades]